MLPAAIHAKSIQTSQILNNSVGEALIADTHFRCRNNRLYNYSPVYNKQGSGQEKY
jgi:hypothetical protein